MIPYERIRIAIVDGLEAYMNMLVIDMNGGGPVPSGEFMTYDFSGGFNSSGGFPAMIHETNKIVQRETVSFTVSFCCYADDKDVSVRNAIKARDWFKMIGRGLLKETLDVVVAEIGEIQNRDINIGEEWERRQGFDVDFRTVDVVEMDLEWIEKVNLQRS